jgi:hypothetical protein
MRYFLTGRQPAPAAILLVESGSRRIFERLIPFLRQMWGEDVFIDLVTCYATLPAGFLAETTRIYGVANYRGREARRKLYRELAANRYSLMGIICSNERIMTKWKWTLAFRIPAKIFIVNENGDFFWLDRVHTKAIRQFAMVRTGLAEAGAVRTIARVVLFPFTVLYLLLYATAVHTRRALRGD